ncbi:MAG: hypothetical protein WBI04_01410 [Trichlorobacter sp.]
MFQLLWVLDLVSDSSRSYISLVFQNIQTKFILVDSIPPELIPYCSIGSWFANGKRLHAHAGKQLTFTIKSTAANNFVEAREAFSDEDFDLSLKGQHQLYSDICRRQLCFVQQVENIKIVIPCFVIAATYYFKSTSLREAILSRRLDSLFDTCTVDNDGHASINLKPGGNIGDAYDIARFKLNSFANQRLNVCKNHLMTNQAKPYQRLKVDFPVEQDLTITGRGKMVNHSDGSNTFIVLDIVSEDSQYPFKSIDIHYHKDENEPDVRGQGGGGTFPKPRCGSSGRMSDKQPAHSNVRHLLESCKPTENPNRKSIKEKKIAIKKPKSDEQKNSIMIYDKEKKDLSTQPSAPGDRPASKAEVREEDENRSPKLEFSIDTFLQMVQRVQGETHTIQIAGQVTEVTVENLSWDESVVPRRANGGSYVTLRESYNHTTTKLRRCAYVSFKCMGRHVCLVEIDQTNAEHIGCSTRILISGSEIDRSFAEACVKDYVDESLLEDRRKQLGDVGIVLRTINHPHASDGVAMKLWRYRLIRKIIPPNSPSPSK